MTRCAVCGACAPDDDAHIFTWTRDGERWLCPECTRDHARAIEARLDREWW